MEDITIRKVLTSTLLAVILLYLVVFLKKQRNLWNRYKNIPGPTPLPLIGSAFMFLGLNSIRGLEKLRHMRSMYGKIYKIWFGNFLLVTISDPDCIENLCRPTSKILLPRSELFYRTGKQCFGDSILISSGDIWKAHRKILSPVFHKNQLEKFVNLLSKNAMIFVEKLKERADGSDIDLFPYVALCSSDAINNIILGTNLNTQVDDLFQYPKFSSEVSESVASRLGNPLSYSDFLFSLTKSGKRIGNILKYFHGHARRALEKQKNSQTLLKAKSMIDIARESGEMTDKEIVDESFAWLVAGTDTLATTFCFVMAVLGDHQDVQERVWEEQWSIFGKDSERPVSSEDMESMTYLEQVIKETLRLYPSAPFLYRVAPEDMDLGKGYHVPKGTQVLVLIYDVHHDPDIYPDPERFDPERFLPDNTVGQNPYAYIPFGAGRRICIGYKFAMMQLKVLLSSVLRRYKIVETVGGLRDIEKSLEFAIVLKPTTGFRIKIIPRS